MIWSARLLASERYLDCATFLIALAWSPTTASTPTENNRIAIMASSSRTPFWLFMFGIVFIACSTRISASPGIGRSEAGVAHFGAPGGSDHDPKRADLRGGRGR